VQKIKNNIKMVNVNPVGWFDLNVANLDRAKKFYETVFNLTLTDLPIEWGKQSLFPFNHESPNISGALVEKADFVSSSNNTVIYFETEDCLAEEKRIEQSGGKVVQPKMNIGEFGFISIFIDTEGNTVGLHSRK
jgi:predicted enzyme related to lactoylglutathione lyase